MKDACHMIRHPKIAIVYCYADGGAGGYRDKAVQFVNTYHQYPPELAHRTIVVCNGVSANGDTQSIFGSMPELSFIDRDGSGWDIGAYQDAAHKVPCEMMVFFGGHTYFRKAGWLARMWETFTQFGNTLYGATGNQGDMRFNIHPHIRTTAFWCSPALLNAYPHQVTTRGGGGQRYEFEHGTTCITTWCRNQGLQPWVVGFDSVFPVTSCDSMPGGYHNGQQHNLIVGDRLTCPPYHHCS